MSSERGICNCAVDNKSRLTVRTNPSVQVRSGVIPELSFSGRTSNRDVTEQVVKLMTGDIPYPETS